MLEYNFGTLFLIKIIKINPDVRKRHKRLRGNIRFGSTG